MSSLPVAPTAPALSNLPAANDMEVSVAVSQRMVRKYLEAAERTIGVHDLEDAARLGRVPKPIQMALRVAEMDARDKVADKESVARVFHTYLPATALAQAPRDLIRNSSGFPPPDAGPGTTYDADPAALAAAPTPDFTAPPDADACP